MIFTASASGCLRAMAICPGRLAMKSAIETAAIPASAKVTKVAKSQKSSSKPSMCQSRRSIRSALSAPLRVDPAVLDVYGVATCHTPLTPLPLLSPGLASPMNV
jgi:hypothetical protein